MERPSALEIAGNLSLKRAPKCRDPSLGEGNSRVLRVCRACVCEGEGVGCEGYGRMRGGGVVSATATANNSPARDVYRRFIGDSLEARPCVPARVSASIAPTA